MYIGNGNIAKIVSHKMFDWTTYSKLTCLQINIDTILFSDRQFDSFFDTTHTVIGVTHENA